ncbi:MAG: 2-C-methyl-D-erythritol 4-phosphate cytidylyltransferase [Aquimonas sp.]|nr:2-C-methyl-D-erythritol 4-phosphate cytidylyltransferase [Aquimonas sp.]
MGGELPKQYLQLAGRSVLEHSLRAVLAHPQVQGAMVATAADDSLWPGWEAIEGKPVLHCVGGAERADSVAAALMALATHLQGAEFWALVHDAARPCLRLQDLDRLLCACLAAGEGGLLGAPVRDTLKRIEPAALTKGEPARALGTQPREALWRAFTPQLFPASLLAPALAACAGSVATDEAGAMERAGHQPLLVEGREDNLKITTPADLALAEFLLARGSAG